MQDLPPTQSVLVVEHTRRASYKASVWSTCHLPQDDLPSPEGWGWTQDNGSWQPLWTASKVCSELVKCGGKTKDGCTTRRCACNKAQWNCKALCKCACSKWTLRHSAEELSWRCIHICYFFVFFFLCSEISQFCFCLIQIIVLCWVTMNNWNNNYTLAEKCAFASDAWYTLKDMSRDSDPELCWLGAGDRIDYYATKNHHTKFESIIRQVTILQISLL